jgi:hypothetical protein
MAYCKFAGTIPRKHEGTTRSYILPSGYVAKNDASLACASPESGSLRPGGGVVEFSADPRIGSGGMRPYSWRLSLVGSAASSEASAILLDGDATLDL